MRQGFGNRGQGQGAWPGNGPFRHLPPWERPGWLYGRGYCWYGVYPNVTGMAPSNPQTESRILQSQRELLEQQLKSLQERLTQIEKRLSELDSE
jgi:hypothetical protein